MSTDFRRLFEHECWANEHVMRALREGASSPAEEYQRAIDKMAHVMAARQMWLSRITGEDPKPRELFPKDVRLTELDEQRAGVESRWREFLAGLDDGDLERVVEYHSTEGGPWRNSLGEILTQLCTHGFYHRGQVATLLGRAGLNAPDTDFIFFARSAP